VFLLGRKMALIGVGKTADKMAGWLHLIGIHNTSL
jgi:hypothetical protein